MGQTYSEGDYIVNDFGADICYNGEGYWSWEEQGRNKVTWIASFASWWGPCQSEAPLIENIYQAYLDNPNVEIVSAGMDWNQPYSCESWATTFGLTYPLLDDDSGNNIYGLFGIGYVPHNVVIGGDGEVMYSQSGFNSNTMVAMIQEGLSNLVLDYDNDGILDDVDNCVENYNPNQEDADEDGMGDVCDPCNSFVFANGDVNTDSELNVADALLLVDILTTNSGTQCQLEASDMNNDGIINVLDVIYMVQSIINGNPNQAMRWIEQNFNYIPMNTINVTK